MKTLCDIKSHFVDEVKLYYNQQLARMYKGEEFFKTCSDEDVEKRGPLMIEILEELDKSLLELRNQGIDITPEVVEKGFEL